MGVNLGAMQNHQYTPYMGGTSTRWTALELVEPQGAITYSPFSLDVGLFSAPIQFGLLGILGHAAEVSAAHLMCFRCHLNKQH